MNASVISNNIYTPQAFLENLTDKCYFLHFNNDVSTEVHKILRANSIESEESPLWDYPLNEIDEVIENGLFVVLVDCSIMQDDCMLTEYRWFEVPEDYVKNFQ